jgi:hypothetical protein
MRKASFIVVLERGQWHVRHEATLAGPYQGLVAAAQAAHQSAEIARKAGIASEVLFEEEPFPPPPNQPRRKKVKK